MTIIAPNRVEGIDWVQEQLDFIPRPLAEQTYFALTELGLLAEGSSGIALTNHIEPEEIRKVAMQTETERDNRQRSAMRLQKRRSVTTNKMHLRQGNSIDMVDENGQVAR